MKFTAGEALTPSQSDLKIHYLQTLFMYRWSKETLSTGYVTLLIIVIYTQMLRYGKVGFGGGGQTECHQQPSSAVLGSD